MKQVDRWLLPDGIHEMLPDEAQKVELLRRRLVDVFQRWGYDYVITPMIEFTDSLLTGAGGDIAMLTFKVTDQLSGKTMGIRADITPQAARMDAHSLKRKGVNRLCYAGHVVHTRPNVALGSRTPLQVGIELFGESGIDADIEVISLLLEVLSLVGLPKQYLDIGHVGVYRALAETAELSAEQEHTLFTLLQAKAATEIKEWVNINVADGNVRHWLLELPKLSGSVGILDRARDVFEEAPAEVMVALDELKALAEALQPRYPDAQLYFDLSELRGYHYHTGIVFGAFSPGVGNAIAKGGRYDHIGEAFGRARPATGFAADLSVISRALDTQSQATSGIFVPACNKPEIWQTIQALRAQGERVISGLSGQTEPHDYQGCDRILVEKEQGFVVEAL
ncbi:ATP phosphoribosyltransferase regulatory subunit [Alteromonadaceae bacterium 2753L.S.0a.02]|nr:ATP phosphoribosyltransferase regulatory subunit [Alteromonadaceae bacterium 2753L.S.0a.02]